MDASQYKNYVLTMLFLKYISDRVKSDPDLYFELPEGCSFDDIAKLKNKPNIGEEIQKALREIAKVNPDLNNIIDKADFDDSALLGSGKAKIDTLSSLVSVFQRDFLDFSSNRAGDDDIIGDAYEYLMKNFAAESGKKKGQFYTPAEVSRLMAQIIGIHKDTRPQISIYDPTCGSGSLLLRAKALANNGVSIFGQELDEATRGMAVMNMYLHGVDDADIQVGDTIEKPFFKQNSTTLMTFDYAVANPPFSQKGWIKGEVKLNDTFGRWGAEEHQAPIPPSSYEDYAFLLHIIQSLKSQGRAACILPNGVLFRGNEEEKIRKKLIERRVIRGIISLPANLFFGTGIPACIIIIDKAKTNSTKGIFMIDARNRFTKDGAKNRLREQDIRRIYDTWDILETLEAENKLDDSEIVPHFARFVSYTEICNERNDGNLNVSRYITPEDTEVRHDIYAHLKLNGGLPAHDVDEDLAYVWHHCPTLKAELFAPLCEGYYSLIGDKKQIGEVINANQEFCELSGHFSAAVEEWYHEVAKQMNVLTTDCTPKALIEEWGDSLLEILGDVDGLASAYDVYDILMRYWQDAMQDDCYLVSREGWKVELSAEVMQTDKKSKEVKFVAKKNPTYRDYTCDLLPVNIVVARYFQAEEDAVKHAEELVAQLSAEVEQLEEEYPDDLNNTLAEIKFAYACAICPEPIDGEEEIIKQYLNIKGSRKPEKEQKNAIIASHPEVFDRLENTNMSTLKLRLKEIRSYAKLPQETIELYKDYITLNNNLTNAKAQQKSAIAKLTKLVVEKYPLLTVDEIKDMVINVKWHTAIVGGAINEAWGVTYGIEEQITALVSRYERRLTDIEQSVGDLEKRVSAHLAKMGF